MATFKVMTDRLVGMAEGSTVDSNDLPKGINVDALVSAGHLAPTVTKPAKEDPKPQPKEK